MDPDQPQQPQEFVFNVARSVDQVEDLSAVFEELNPILSDQLRAARLGEGDEVEAKHDKIIIGFSRTTVA